MRRKALIRLIGTDVARVTHHINNGDRAVTYPERCCIDYLWVDESATSL